MLWFHLRKLTSPPSMGLLLIWWRPKALVMNLVFLPFLDHAHDSRFVSRGWEHPLVSRLRAEYKVRFLGCECTWNSLTGVCKPKCTRRPTNASMSHSRRRDKRMRESANAEFYVPFLFLVVRSPELWCVGDSSLRPEFLILLSSSKMSVSYFFDCRNRTPSCSVTFLTSSSGWSTCLEVYLGVIPFQAETLLVHTTS